MGGTRRVEPSFPLAAPNGNPLVTEARGLLQIPRVVLKSPRLLRLPRGQRTVMAIPGYRTSDNALLPLRSLLLGLGHRVFGWGFGVNLGEVDAMIGPVTERVRQIAERTDTKVALIGWSNGGVFAREVARDEPDLVDRVITIGTPIWGGPRYTVSARFFSDELTKEIEDQIVERNQIPIEVPVTSIWSKRDGIVDWRACVDDFTPGVENIEVGSGHASALIDPDVLTAVATRLGGGAQPLGTGDQGGGR